MRLTISLIVCLCFTVPARADWQFTHWGMTPEQVVAASRGSANFLPAGKRPSIPPLETLAEGTFEDGPLSLRTVFSFDTTSGGLRCVTYGPISPDGNGAFRAGLVKRLGPPQMTSALPAIGMETLGWNTESDQIDASFMSDAPAFVMHCAKKT